MNLREILNAIFSRLRTGWQWNARPKDLPPKSTVREDLGLWDRDGTPGRIHHALSVEARERAGREASPTTAITDPKRQGCSDKGPRSTPPGDDAGWKVQGRKRHILTDTFGLLLAVSVHRAGVQDRDGAEALRPGSAGVVGLHATTSATSARRRPSFVAP